MKDSINAELLAGVREVERGRTEAPELPAIPTELWGLWSRRKGCWMSSTLERGNPLLACRSEAEATAAAEHINQWGYDVAPVQIKGPQP